MRKKNSIHYKNLRWLWWSVFIFIADQVSKWLALHYLVIGKPITLFSWLNLHLNFNKGAAFSFLHHAGGWQRWFLVALAIVICIAIIVWLCRLPRQEKLMPLGLALVFGGAIGNLWDRAVLGHVIDFIEVHAYGWYFPDFNIADSAITVGAFLLLFKVLRS